MWQIGHTCTIGSGANAWWFVLTTCMRSFVHKLFFIKGHACKQKHPNQIHVSRRYMEEYDEIDIKYVSFLRNTELASICVPHTWLHFEVEATMTFFSFQHKKRERDRKHRIRETHVTVFESQESATGNDRERERKKCNFVVGVCDSFAEILATVKSIRLPERLCYT